jgi:hypothetical protein
MWFRIELHKDGSVSSCVEVEGSFKDSKTVHYVEADSKEDAIGKLKARWELYRERRTAKNERERLRRKNLGLCERYGCPDKNDGIHTLCATHHEYVKQKRKESDARKSAAGFDRLPEHIRLAKRTDEEKAAIQARRDRAAREHKAKYTAKYGSGRLRRLQVLRKALRQFDSMTPRAFRAWLAQEIYAIESRAKDVAA